MSSSVGRGNFAAVRKVVQKKTTLPPIRPRVKMLPRTVDRRTMLIETEITTSNFLVITETR